MAKVRIRKAAPGENPGYYNKTAMFLNKAQMGTEVQSEEGQGQPQEDMMQAYYQYAQDQLSSEAAPDRVYTELVSKGLPEDVAYQMITTLMDQLVEQGVINPDYKRDKAAEKQQEGQGQETEETPTEEAPPAQEQEDDSMYEEDQDMVDLEEDYLQDRSYMQSGGSLEYTEDDYDAQNGMLDQYNQVKDNTQEPFNMQELISKTPGIQPGLNFPSLGEYIPDYQNLQWSNMDALQPTQTDQNLPPQLESQKMGGLVKKKQFVKNVMALLKKEEGGDNTEQPEGEEEKEKSIGKGILQDNITGDVQKFKNNFLNTVKTEANTVKTKEMYDKLKKSNDPSLQQLGMQEEQPQEQMPEQPFQVGGMTGGQDPLFRFLGGGDQEDPDYYEADFVPEAKYGYSTGNLRRAQKGVNFKGMDMDPGFRVNPATGQPWTSAEWAAKKKIIDDATEGMSRRQKEAWIQQQLLLRQQQQPKVNAQGVPIASINYVPNYITGSGSWMRNLTPWNPLVESSRTVMPMNNPYLYGTNTPYMDPLTGMKPVARQVTERGILGRPKRYTDIYSLPGAQSAQEEQIIADNGQFTFPSKNQMPRADLSLLDNPHGDNQSRQQTDTSELGIPGSMAVRQGERQVARDERRLARHPELLNFRSDKEEVNAPVSPEMEEEMQYEDTPEEYMRQSLTLPAGEREPVKRYPFEGTMENVSGPIVDGEMAYGGYVPRAQNGLTINNPNLPQPGPANPDLAVGNQPGLIGKVSQGPNTVWSQQQSFNQPAPTNTGFNTAQNQNTAGQMTAEPLGDDLSNCTEAQKRDSTSKCYQAGKSTMVGVDYGVGKNTNVDLEATNNIVNAGMNTATNILTSPEEKAKEAKMYENLSSDNLYASQATKHRGDWVDLGSQAGQYRFDQMGQDRSGFSSYGKYGGYMQEGGQNTKQNYSEGDEVYMTDDDIKNFMANGGQIEYI